MRLPPDPKLLQHLVLGHLAFPVEDEDLGGKKQRSSEDDIVACPTVALALHIHKTDFACGGLGYKKHP